MFMAHKSDNGAYWMPLLEKAYSKMYGSFAAINGGQEHIAMSDLTGMPT
jgi:hypothetical protein